MLTDPDAGATAEAEVWLRQMRIEADRATHARAVGSEAMEAAARTAGRRVLDHIMVLLLQAADATPGDGALADALSAACAAELARLEGREDAERWHFAEQQWLRAGRPEEAEDARRRAHIDRSIT